MQRITTRSDRHRRLAATAAVLALALASLTLVACGGSSTSTASTASASANASPPTGGAGAPANAGSRFAKVRECMEKNGVTLPKRTPGQRPAPGAGGSGGQLPNGVSRTKFQEAAKKCGLSARGFGAGRRNFNSPAFRQSLAKFATCMREHGVDVPAPNTSGKGPVFNTKGLDTSSATFRNAESKCRSNLSGSFGARPGAAAGAGTPPAAAG